MVMVDPKLQHMRQIIFTDTSSIEKNTKMMTNKRPSSKVFWSVTEP